MNTTIITLPSYRSFAFGQKGFYSLDFINYHPLNMNGVTGGEVTSVTYNSTYMFVGTQSGGVFRRDLDEVVPVELASFSACLINNQVRLEWQTQTETNNYGFEIQRCIDNTADWDKVGFVQGRGTTSEPQRYDFIDKLTNIKSNCTEIQYRLKQLDMDGSYAYSQIEIVNLHVPQTHYLLQNYPNPFNPVTRISFELQSSSLVHLNVFDLNGKEVAQLVDKSLSAGIHEYNWDAQHLASGTYICVLDVYGSRSFSKMILLK